MPGNSPQNSNYEEFRRFVDGKAENQKGLDNVIFVLSTGVFVLSINFILGNESRYLYHESLLLFSWVCLALAVICHAIAYKFAIGTYSHAIDRMIGIPNQNYDAKIKAKTICASILDNVSLVLVVLGILAITIFASYNFVKHNNENLQIEQTYLTINNK